MARYSIDGQTLTNIADAVRVGAGETKTVMGEAIYDYTYTKYNSSFAVAYTVPGASGVIVRNISSDINVEAAKISSSDVKVAPGVYTSYDDMPDTYHFSLRNDTDPFPTEDLIFYNTDTISFGRGQEGGALYWADLKVSATIIGLDENGEVLMNKEVEVLNAFTPEQMPDEINAFAPKAAILNNIIDRSVSSITADQLAGITGLGANCFEGCTNLRSLELPEGIQRIGTNAFANTNISSLVLPSTVNSVHNSAFHGVAYNSILTILNDTDCITVISSSVLENTNFSKVRVSGKLFDAYRANGSWSSCHVKMVPYDEYVPISYPMTLLEYNQSTTITIPLTNFDYIPEYSVSADDAITITDVNATNTEITFTVNSGEVEGTYPVSVEITTQSGYIFTPAIKVKVISEFVDGTYTVSNPSNHTYTFILNDNGYYESTNQATNGSYSFCRININNPMGQTVSIDCINYAEANYDYGLFGKVNNDCSTYNITKMESNAQYSFKGKSSANVQTITYNDAIDECFIDVMYKKDGSGDQNADSLQFQVRFG